MIDLIKEIIKKEALKLGISELQLIQLLVAGCEVVFGKSLTQVADFYSKINFSKEDVQENILYLTIGGSLLLKLKDN
jgi:hypothetical protein